MIDRKPTLCVVAGPNGSGKTTTTDGQLFKQYVEDIPEWASMLLK